MREAETRGRSKEGRFDQSAEEKALKLVSEQLRRLRSRRGLTQSEMEEIGVSYKYYQRIEAGKANITVKTLVRVMTALGFEFFGFCSRQKLKRKKDAGGNKDEGRRRDSEGEGGN